VIKRFKIFLSSVTLLLFLNPALTKSQILKDSISLNLVKESVNHIYNLELADARKSFTKLSQAFPGHPAIFMLEGMITYWENYPLSPSSPACVSFENNLRKCIDLCGKKENGENDAEYLLTNLAARGMLLLFYSDNNLSMEVIPLAASTYQYIRRCFKYTSVYNDFYFFTGLYNYSREAYPEAYPVYKPLALLFPKGDKSKGLKEMQSAAKNSILFKAESYSFLSGISIGFENNFEQACSYSKSLHELYPYNLQYLGMLIRNLLLIKQYNEAEKLMGNIVPNISNSYYQAQLSLFNGILQEKKYHNDKLAKEYYTNGIHGISLFGHYGNEFAAYGYFGLSRISERNGDSNYRKIYRKKAIELADFRNVNFDE
jgi:hypothetical protein